MKKNKEYKKILRPPRLYINKKGHRYVKFRGKKMKIDSKLSNKNLVKVVINNMSEEKKRRRIIRKPLKKVNHSLIPPEANSSSMNLILRNLNDDLQKLKTKKLLLKNAINNNNEKDTPMITLKDVKEELPKIKDDEAIVLMKDKPPLKLNKKEIENKMNATKILKKELDKKEIEIKEKENLIKKQKEIADEEAKIKNEELNRIQDEKKKQEEEKKKIEQEEEDNRIRKENNKKIREGSLYFDSIKNKKPIFYLTHNPAPKQTKSLFKDEGDKLIMGSRGNKEKERIFADRKKKFEKDLESNINEIRKSDNPLDKIFIQKLDQKFEKKPMNEAFKITPAGRLTADPTIFNINIHDEEFENNEPQEEQEEEEAVQAVQEEEQEGEGLYLRGKGLWNDEIDKIMEPFKNEGYLGTISSDEIKNLIPKVKKGNKYSFIMNLSKKKDRGSHWIAVYIDPIDDMSLEYFDSLAQPPSKQFQKDIKYLIDKLKPDTYLKFKINKIKKQSDSTDTCGWMAIKFLEDRYNNIEFKDSTGYNDVKRGEKEANELKNNLTDGFGYI